MSKIFIVSIKSIDEDFDPSVPILALTSKADVELLNQFLIELFEKPFEEMPKSFSLGDLLFKRSSYEEELFGYECNAVNKVICCAEDVCFSEVQLTSNLSI